MDDVSVGRRWSAVECVLLAVVFAVTSWFPVDFVLGGGGAQVGSRAWPVTSFPAAVVSAVVAVVVLDRHVVRRRPPVWVCAAAVVGSWCLAAWVYLRWMPRYRPVTDRATALEIGWRALTRGENPYAFHTQLGNPIAPLPGGLVLAGPSVSVFGDLRWYGLSWAALVLAVCWWGVGRRAAVVVAVLGVLSPMIRLELYSQSDAWINAAALVVFGSAGWVAVRRAGVSRAWVWAAAGAGVLFGFAVAYRVILAPVALPLAVVMWRRVGLRSAAAFVVPAAFVAVVATLTPVIVDPSATGPWAMAAHHAESPRTPFLGVILAAAMLVVTAVGAWRARSLAGVWATSAVSLAVMVALVFWGQAKGHPTYETVAYDGALLVFTLAALVAPRAVSDGGGTSHRERDAEVSDDDLPAGLRSRRMIVA